MPNIVEKSVGTLIDELITTDIKCWFAQESVMHSDNVGVIANAAKDAQNLNARRNLLIRAIDEKLGDSAIAPTSKSYGV